MKPYFVFLLVGCLVLSACEMTDIETIGDAETVKSIQDKALSFNNRTEYLAEWQNYIDANAPVVLKKSEEIADRARKSKYQSSYKNLLAALAPESIQDVSVIGFPVFTVPKEIYGTAQRGADVKSVAILDTMFIQYFILSKDVPMVYMLFQRTDQQLKLFSMAEMETESSLALQQALKLKITCYAFRIPTGNQVKDSMFEFVTLDNKKRHHPYLIPEFQDMFNTALAWRQY